MQSSRSIPAMPFHFLRLLAVVLVVFGAPLHAGEYRKIIDNGVTFHTYTADASELKIHWKNAEGTPIRQLDALSATLESEGRKIQFLGNAGIFMENGTPLGLYIEDGKELRPVNKVKDAYGNFYLQPNGIFFVENGKARVTTTDLYLEGKHRPTLASQSGPMLVIDGKIHPQFNENSTNRTYRNGVGILPDGRILLAITDNTLTSRVNLHGFATLFLKQGCQNALYFDGGLSAVRIPAANIRIDTGRPLGPLLSVSSPATAGQ